jgi:site-specific DNA recombinase
MWLLRCRYDAGDRKGGRYRYYKCNTRIGKGTTYCTACNIPMEKLDMLVLGSLADKVFTPART